MGGGGQAGNRWPGIGRRGQESADGGWQAGGGYCNQSWRIGKHWRQLQEEGNRAVGEKIGEKLVLD
jgi:hypothetical protein